MYDELKSNIYDDVVAYLDTVIACEFHESVLDDSIISNVCDVIDKSFDRTFFAPAPISLDSTPQN